ncbi:MAG TPA: NifU family protein [Verrucomicrobiae bacterium]|nr:NifU family protein [Verrucomicrobiae bacterium]
MSPELNIAEPPRFTDCEMPKRYGATQKTDRVESGKRIQELIGQIEAMPNPAARALLQECVQSLLSLYGEGLGRALEIVRNDFAGKTILDQFAEDEILRALLLVHGLHPVSLDGRLRGALEKVRPYMKSHGGNVELISLENDFARLRLEGACKSCPASSVTLELAVRHAIEEACPDLAGFEVEGAINAANGHSAK